MTRIPKSEYARRRKALMEQMEPNSIAILPAAPMYIRNRDVEHVYRQDSDFQYLSGFPEPEAVIALIPGREHGEYVLFCRERDPERELWDGLRAGQDGAISEYGADDAFPIGDIDDILPGLIEGRERVYYAMGTNQEFDRHLMEWINVIRSKARQGAQPPNEFVALDHLLHDMRLYKSAAEVKVMKESAQISARAHIRAMQASREQAQQSVSQASEAGSALQAITSAVNNINQMNSHIAAASDQQLSVSQQLNSNIHNIEELTNESATTPQQLTAAGSELTELSGQIQAMVSEYKT